MIPGVKEIGLQHSSILQNFNHRNAKIFSIAGNYY